MQSRTQTYILKNKPILDALIRLKDPFQSALICVDEANHLQGTISESNIRDGLIAGANLNDPITTVMNVAPISVNEQVTNSEATALISAQVNILPVVDKDNVVVGYYNYRKKEPNFSIQNKTVTILGVGYVGLTLGLTLAEQGFKVKGYDKNDALVTQLNAKEAPFFEVGIGELLDKNSGQNICFTKNIDEANSDIYIITVGTPLIKSEKRPNIDYIRSAATTIGQQLSKGDLVLLRSTVPVGCSREVVLPVLERESGLKCGQDFYLAFAPERTAEGVALRELYTNPQIIGGFDENSFAYAKALFQTFTPTVMNVGGLEAAELCKLMDNTYRDHIFAYANNIAELAEKLGINIHKLIKAVNFGYKRNQIPRPSPGVGGPCLSKDPYILASVFERHQIETNLLVACRQVNEKAPFLIREKLTKLLKQAGKDIEKATIALIGMAFKGDPETSDLRDSTSLWVLDALPNRSKIKVYDPVVKRKELKALGVLTPKSMKGVFKNTDAVIILNNHKSYQKMNLTKLFSLMNKPAIFIDTWQNFSPLKIKQFNGILYGGLGNV